MALALPLYDIPMPAKPPAASVPTDEMLATVVATLQGNREGGRVMVDQLPPWPLHRYEHLERIHTAIYGSVHLMLDVELQERVCVKMLDSALVFGDHGASLTESPLAEMAAYALLRRQTRQGEAATPHLAEMKGAYCCQQTGQLMLVTAFYELGEMFNLVRNTKDSPEAVVNAADQTLRAVAELHSRGLAHRDISLENLWLHSDSVLKLGDFGQVALLCAPSGLLDASSRQHQGEHWQRGSAQAWGKVNYMPPEVAQKRDYLSSKVDVYAVGVVIFAMATARFPWGGAIPLPQYQSSDFDILSALRQVVHEEQLQAHLSPLLVDLIASMLNPDPTKRPTAVQALSHSYFCQAAPSKVDKAESDVNEFDDNVADFEDMDEYCYPVPPGPEMVPISSTL